MNGLTWTYPWVLWFLLLLPAVGWWGWRRSKRCVRLAVADKSLDKIIHAVASEQQKRWDRQKLPSTHISRLRKTA